MFDYMDGIMQALAKQKTQWKEDLFFAVMLARHKLCKYYTEVTPMTRMLLISAHILDRFRKLRLCWKWDKGMDINPEYETFYTTQYHEVLLNYGQNEYCAKHRRVPVNQLECFPSRNLILSAMASGSSQSSFDPYGLSSDDEEYWTPKYVVETTPGQSYRTVRILTAARLDLNSPPESPRHWGQINPVLND